MSLDDLQRIAHRQPFRPFRVVLTTGATYDIRHPELLMLGTRSAVIGFSHDADSKIYDGMYQVDLLHIVGVQDLPGPQPSANGPSA